MTISLIHRLYKQKVIDCPDWLPDNLCYLTVMGSRAYGVENKDSDYDYYGFAMIPRKNIFPHEYGLLLGLDQIPKFEQWRRDHFIDADSGKDMEFTIYGIVRYAQLLYDGNPNIIESLFTRRECVIYSTTIGEKFRENRKIFLSKKNFLKTRSYAFSQLKKLNRVPEGNRLEDYKRYGFSTKFAGHCIRLIDNCEQILHGDLDLHRNKEMVKAIRRGEWKLEQVKEWAHNKEIALEKALVDCQLPEKPDINLVRELVLDCIKHCYQKVEFVQPNRERDILNQIRELVK